MNPNMAGEDASLDSAVATIAAKLRGDEQQRPDPRENREDRDAIERENSTDLEESERLEREARADDENAQGEKPAEVESKDGAEAEAEDDAQYIELPPVEEGGTPERIPLTEALEAVQKVRQMDGEIATAVIRAEEEAFAKQDQITQQLNTTFSTVVQQARVALAMMDQYLPAPPDPIMLDENSGYYDPAAYHRAKLYYDGYAAHYQKVAGVLKQAELGAQSTAGVQDAETVRRETDRAARYIPEFKDDKTRAARKDEILQALSPKYGFKKEDLDEIVDHRAWRALNDLAKAMTAERKAPEVRKQLTETKPKIVNGRVSQTRDPQSGRFTSEARKELRDTGSIEAAARLFMRSGVTKGL